jgi:malate dehydrogenase (oxaloacetate-decarboxylating)
MNEKTANDSNTRTPTVPAVLDDPIRNRGVAFSAAEREALGLTGRLPSGVLDLEQQARRAYQQLQARGSDLAKNVYMEQLHDRHEGRSRRSSRR